MTRNLTEKQKSLRAAQRRVARLHAKGQLLPELAEIRRAHEKAVASTIAGVFRHAMSLLGDLRDVDPEHVRINIERMTPKERIVAGKLDVYEWIELAVPQVEGNEFWYHHSSPQYLMNLQAGMWPLRYPR